MSTKQNISEIKFPVKFDSHTGKIKDADGSIIASLPAMNYSDKGIKNGQFIAVALNGHAQIKDENEKLKSACEMALKHFEARERICNAEGGSVYVNEINQLKGALQNGK